MNFNTSPPIDLETAFALAEDIAKSKSPKAKFILDLIINKEDRAYLNLCYAYLRWVDDYVDDPQNKIADKIDFISRQKTLCEQFKHFITDSKLNSEESFLFYFVDYVVKKNKIFLQSAVKEMLDSIEMDAQRLMRKGSFSFEEMQIYIEKNAKAFFTLITSFVEPNNPFVPANIFIGRFAAKLFMLRDFAEDIERGYVNITTEDLEFYEIDVSNLKDDQNLINWTKDEYRKLIILLFEEAMVVKKFSFKLKIFNYYSQIYYLPKICRIAANDFDILNTQNRSNLFTEIMTYFFSLKLAVKLFIIEFT